MSEHQGIRMILFGILLAIIGAAFALAGDGLFAFVGVIVMFFGLLFGVMGQFGVSNSQPE